MGTSASQDQGDYEPGMHECVNGRPVGSGYSNPAEINFLLIYVYVHYKKAEIELRQLSSY